MIEIAIYLTVCALLFVLYGLFEWKDDMVAFFIMLWPLLAVVIPVFYAFRLLYMAGVWIRLTLMAKPRPETPGDNL